MHKLRLTLETLDECERPLHGKQCDRAVRPVLAIADVRTCPATRSKTAGLSVGVRGPPQVDRNPSRPRSQRHEHLPGPRHADH